MGAEHQVDIETGAAADAGDVTEAPVRYAGQPVPIGRSPWMQPPQAASAAQPPRAAAPAVSASVAPQPDAPTAPPLALVPAAPETAPSQPSAPGVYPTRRPSRPASSNGAATPRASMARDFGGVRQITVANPAPYSGKTATVDALHRTFRTARTDVVTWDSDGLDERTFARERDRLAEAYRLLIVDTGGPDIPALDATDQLVIAVDSRAGSVRAAEALLASLDATDQAALSRNAVVVIAVHGADDTGSRASTASQQAAAEVGSRFAKRTRAVFAATPEAWPRIAQTIADGL